MNSQIINVTALVIARNVADALADAPNYPYQMAFSIPYYQHKLLVYVLNRVRSHYVVQQGEAPSQALETMHYFAEELANIEALIQESLDKVLEAEPDWTEHIEILDSRPVFYGIDRIK